MRFSIVNIEENLFYIRCIRSRKYNCISVVISLDRNIIVIQQESREVADVAYDRLCRQTFISTIAFDSTERSLRCVTRDL